MRITSKRGSYIMEAAIVLPVIIFVTITAVLIVMFFYSQMTERCRLHMTLRYEAGQMTEMTEYTAHTEYCNTEDAEIYRERGGMGGDVYGNKDLIMSQKGVLHRKGTFTVEGSCHAADGVTYVRYCNAVNGGVNGI